MIEKNVAGQTWVVFAFDESGDPVTGDAANITAKLSKDGGALAATDDTNPTEMESGYYRFTLLQAETDANVLDLIPVSNTSGVNVVASPARVFTVAPNANALGINSSGHILRTVLNDTTTTNSDMRGTDSALTSLGATAPAGWLNAAAFASGAFDAVWSVTTRTLSAFSFAVETDTASREASKADVSGLALEATAQAVKTETDKIATLTEDSSGLRFTQKALEEAPTGGSAPTAEQIRTEIDNNSTQLSAIKAKTDNLNFTGSDVQSVASNMRGTDDALLAASYTAPPDTASIASAVWSAGSRTLTGFGTLVADVTASVWAAATRTLTAFGFTPGVDMSQATPGGSTVGAQLDAAGTGGGGGGSSNWSDEQRDQVLDQLGQIHDGTTVIRADDRNGDPITAGGGDVIGPGSIEKTLTVNDIANNPIDGVAVWVTTDAAGTNVIAGTRHTDGMGEVTFMLDAGTYYAWRQKNGVNFNNPQSFEVSA